MVGYDWAIVVELITAVLTAIYIAKLLVQKGEIDRLLSDTNHLLLIDRSAR